MFFLCPLRGRYPATTLHATTYKLNTLDIGASHFEEKENHSRDSTQYYHVKLLR
jgi:hypothetical protein